jgi:hypothetical protein
MKSVSTWVIFLVLAAGAWAQTPDGRISGTVTDSSGAVVPGVEIELTSEETGNRFSAISDEQGRYLLPRVPPGRWRLTARLTGFRTYQRTGITVGTSEQLVVEARLEVGEVTETVTVTGGASLLETSTSDVSQLIEPRNVSELPLNGRRAISLAAGAPATVWVNYSGNAKPNFSLAGGRTQSQVFWIDGGNGQNMRLGVGQIDSDPPVEVVRELRILSNSFSAEFGGSAGGLVIMTTKSGTNEFHGSAFEYLRNDAVDAANSFAPFDSKTGEKTKAPLRYNLFGVTAGGPIRQNRTHFFAGWEATRQRVGSTEILTVPTPLQRSGDFSQTFTAAGALIPLYDPATTRTEAGRTVRDRFTDNRIPQSRLDAVALKILNFYPLPNQPASNLAGANNFAGNWTEAFTRDNVTARLDHVLTTKDKLYARYIFNQDPLSNTTVLPDPRTNTRNTSDRFQHMILGVWNRTLSAHWLNELRYSWATRRFHNASTGLDGKWDQELGLRGIDGEAFPQFTVAGIAALGAGTHERRQFPIRQHQFIEAVTVIHGGHAVKFGAEIRKSTNDEVLRTSISGQFAFNTQPTGLPGTAGTGFGFASLLVGIPNTFTLRSTEPLNRYSWYLAAYLQDDWRVRSDLTLNLGVRWETDTPMVDRNQRMNGFDRSAINPVSGTPGIVRFAGVDGWPNNLADADWNNFGPRVGFAWRPFGGTKTVVRGGFGVFFAHPYDAGVPNQASLGFEKSAILQTPDNGITAPFVLATGVPSVQLTGAARDASFGAVRVGSATTTNVTFFERERRTGYSQQFNLGVQRAWRGVVVEVGYLGNLSRKLANTNLTLNQIPPERMGPTATQRDRPFPQFTNVVIQRPSLGVTDYHAGFAKVERRFSGGVSFLGTYTWAKNIGNASPGSDSLGDTQEYQNFYNRRLDKGPSELDINHRFTGQSVLELPFGSKRRWLGSSPLRHVAGGWSLGSIAVLQGGPPMSLWMQTDGTSAFPAGAQRVNLLRDPNLPVSERSIGRWFDTTAVAAPPSFQFGNAGNGIVRTDGKINFDFSLIKNFSFSEQRYIQFRIETFNAFNHPNFGLPGRTLNGPGFGIISSADPGRITQFGLRAVF